MTPEWVGAISSLLTMLVITGTAVAAIIQLRHTRASNQIVALTEMREAMLSRDFQSKLRDVYGGFTERLGNPEFLQQLATLPRVHGLPELEAALTVVNFYESAGCLVKNRIIDPTIFCDLYYTNILGAWNALAPFIFARRIIGGPATAENFEYLAVLAREFEAKHPNGAYPTNMPRMPKPEESILG